MQLPSVVVVCLPLPVPARISLFLKYEKKTPFKETSVRTRFEWHSLKKIPERLQHFLAP